MNNKTFIKRITAILLSFVLCLSMVPVQGMAEEAGEEPSAAASGSCGENLTWTLDEEGLLTISGTGSMTDYLYAERPWKAFADSIKSVVMEEGVTSIGSFAFGGCASLTSVTIPEGVISIGDEAFIHCDGLTSVTIPGSVGSIGERALSYCSSLESIFVSEGNVNYKSIDGVLYNSSVTGIIAYPTGKSGSFSIPEGVTDIHERAFVSCEKLTAVTIPASVMNIGSFAFSDCTALTDVYYSGTAKQWNNVTIGSGNKSLNNAAFHPVEILASGSCGENLSWTFYENGLFTISGSGDMTDFATIDEVPWADYKNSIVKIELEEGATSIGSHAFNGCTSLTSVTIPEGISSIGDYGFSNCFQLPAVSLPGSLKNLGIQAFSFCTVLTDISIPSSVTSIGLGAFYACHSLERVFISDGVTSIGDEAFAYCESLVSITVDENNPSYKSTDGVLFNKAGTELIVCPAAGKSGAYIIPEGVTSIACFAFHNCSSLTSIIIPESVTNIGNNAFNSCFILSKIDIPAGVTSIGNSTFAFCYKLSSIILPAGLTSIGDYAFARCDNLKDVYFLGTEEQWSRVAIGKYESAPFNEAVIQYSCCFEAVIADTGRTLSTDDILYINQYCKITSKKSEIIPEYVCSHGGLLVFSSAVSEEEATYENASSRSDAYIVSGLLQAGDEYTQRTTGIVPTNYNHTYYIRIYLQQSDGSYAYMPLKEYGVHTYCNNCLEKSTDEKLKTLCSAILSYGNAAEAYFSA